MGEQELFAAAGASWSSVYQMWRHPSGVTVVPPLCGTKDGFRVQPKGVSLWSVDRSQVVDAPTAADAAAEMTRLAEAGA